MRMDWNLYVENTHQNSCSMAIVLKKGGDSHRINLDKKTGNALTGEIVINLDWNKGGFWKSLLGNAIDLDLGCFYEMRNGQKMLIDGLLVE